MSRTKAHIFATLALGITTGCVATDYDAGSDLTRINACEVAKDYIRLTDEGHYDEVGDLWAADAVFYNPRGDIIRGQPAIKQFYSSFLRQITPINRIASLAWDPETNVCVMELETRVVRGADGKWVPSEEGDFVPTAIDRFVVNAEGKVQEMRVYLPPDKAWLD